MVDAAVVIRETWKRRHGAATQQQAMTDRDGINRLGSIEVNDDY